MYALKQLCMSLFLTVMLSVLYQIHTVPILFYSFIKIVSFTISQSCSRGQTNSHSSCSGILQYKFDVVSSTIFAHHILDECSKFTYQHKTGIFWYWWITWQGIWINIRLLLICHNMNSIILNIMNVVQS